jgi:hypothetical protein
MKKLHMDYKLDVDLVRRLSANNGRNEMNEFAASIARH